MNSTRTAFKEEIQAQEGVGPRTAVGKDLSQLLCVPAAGLVLLRACMLSWSCPVVALDERGAAVPESLQSLTAASGQDSSPWREHVSLFLVCFV